MSGVEHGNDGLPCNPVPFGSHILPISVRATAATAAPATIWAMRNGGTRTLYIRKILLQAVFDGTPAGSEASYAIKRFTAATPSGGTAISPIKKRSSYPVSTLADARFLDTGLTVAGVTFENAAINFGGPRQNGAACEYNMSFDMGGNENYDCFVLAPNEGLAIQLANAAVIGDSIQGHLEYDERLA
jgi:hypothetical protein